MLTVISFYEFRHINRLFLGLILFKKIEKYEKQNQCYSACFFGSCSNDCISSSWTWQLRWIHDHSLFHRANARSHTIWKHHFILWPSLSDREKEIAYSKINNA
jgi:hypothetical protein